jgi:hypothetical protein
MYMGVKMGIEKWDGMCQNGYIFFFIHSENVMYGVVSLYRDTYSRHGMKACTHVEG